MKILHVISVLSPKFGGLVSALYQLSKELAKKGHEVTIVTSDYRIDTNFAKNIEEYGIKVISFRTVVNFGLFIYTPSIKFWLKNNIKSFDVIHLHEFRSYQNIEVHNFAIKFGIPYIIQPNGTVLPFFEKKTLKKLYDLFYGDMILKNASNHIASSKNELDQIKSMGIDENKITIIPSCIDLSEFENLPPNGTFKAKYGIRQDEKVILFLGRIHKIKGIDLLVDAFFDLSNEMADIKLVIIGPDAGFLNFLLKKIDNLKIPEKIIYIGFIDKSDKTAAYIDADLFVLPSQYETFGLTVLEAWSCGTPVIVSEGCLISEFLPNKDIIFKRDKNRLKDLIKKILQDDELKLKLKNDGEQLIKNQFNWSKLIEKYILIYSDVIRKI
jgi:glycosyltransferase involved in cell wall biosynthesis